MAPKYYHSLPHFIFFFAWLLWFSLLLKILLEDEVGKGKENGGDLPHNCRDGDDGSAYRLEFCSVTSTVLFFQHRSFYLSAFCFTFAS